MTPLTSPTVEAVGYISSSIPTEVPMESAVIESGENFAEDESEMAKFSLEIDGVSVQFDVQEKCTDLILKVSAVGANLHRRNLGTSGGRGGGINSRLWIPYLSSEKILSSKGSALPAELSEILAHSSSAGKSIARHTV